MKAGMNEALAAETVAKMATRTMHTGGTPNQRTFAEWLLEASAWNGDAEAFYAGAMLAVNAYKVWQAAKPTSANYAAPVGQKITPGKAEIARQTTNARARAKAATDRAVARTTDAVADVSQEAAKAAPGRVTKPRARKAAPRPRKATAA